MVVCEICCFVPRFYCTIPIITKYLRHFWGISGSERSPYIGDLLMPDSKRSPYIGDPGIADFFFLNSFEGVYSNAKDVKEEQAVELPEDADR